MSDNPTQPTEGQQQNPPPAVATTGTGTGQQPGTSGAATFTQDELNKIVRERVRESGESAVNKLLTSLGMSDIEALKTATTKYKEFSDAQLTAQQKLERDLATTTTTLTSTQDRNRALAIENAALKAFNGQVAPDRIGAAIKLLDTSKLSVGEDGIVKGMAEAITALLEENPFLKPSEVTPPPPKDNKKPPPIDATNPAGGATTPDLSWHPLKRSQENRLQGGGIVMPKETK